MGEASVVRSSEAKRESVDPKAEAVLEEGALSCVANPVICGWLILLQDGNSEGTASSSARSVVKRCNACLVYW